MDQQDGSVKVLAVEAMQRVVNFRTRKGRRREPTSQNIVLRSSQVHIRPPCAHKNNKQKLTNK